MNERFDCVVVGAGSTGTVLAARLAEWTNRSVLLVEAGPDYRAGEAPSDVQMGVTPALDSHDWGQTATTQLGRQMWLPRGKLVGGCSSINSCIALRPEPADFDSWVSCDVIDWSWPSVLESFIFLESDSSEVSANHGLNGPLQLMRTSLENTSDLSRCFHSACLDVGFEAVIDHNQPGTAGVGPLPLNLNTAQQRISTALAYLEPVRNLPNLTVMSETLVQSIVFEGDTAVGVRVVQGADLTQIEAEEVFVCAGTFGSPALLQRSGLGPAAMLSALGIGVIADLPAIGENLADHSQVPIICAPRTGALAMSAPCAEIVLRYAEERANDMQIYLLNHVELAQYAPAVAEESGLDHAFVVTANLMDPESRGTVRILNTDPRCAPAIHMDYLNADVDRRRLRGGVRLARDIASTDSLQEHLEGFLALADVEFEDDTSVDQYVAEHLQTAHHPTGTASMGVGAETAVVDSQCRVFDTQGLRVADASIIPTPIRANTNLTCVMIGEHLAAAVAGRVLSRGARYVNGS